MSRILDAALSHARRRPNAVAVRKLAIGNGSGDTTWEELARLGDAEAKRLREGQGVVTIPLRASADSISIMLGAMASGRPFAFLDPRLRPPQMERIESRVRENDPGGETACVLFTSGSTGEPKGVRISRDDLSARAFAEVAAFGLTPTDRLLSLLVFAFDVGLNQLCSSLVAGATLVLQPSWLPADILDSVRDEEITGISAVPAVWRAFLLLSELGFEAHEHARLRYLTISGGDLPSPHLARMEKLAGPAGIIKTYGQTETFRSAMLLASEFADRPGSVGRAFPGARFAIDDRTTRIYHSGLGTMLGYLGEDGDPPVSIDTGDRGSVDEDGYLFIAGRDDDMVKRAGNRVYPEEVVRALIELPSIADAEVVAVRDDEGEAHLAAFVIVEGTAGPIRRELSKKLPGYMVPSHIAEVTAYPLTTSGKPDRQRLQRLAAEALGLL